MLTEQTPALPIESGPLWQAINQHSLVSMADLTGHITYANDNFVRLSGYSREELLGQNHRIVKSGVQDDTFWASLWATISSGHVWAGEVCNRARNGSLYWVNTQISPVFDAHGCVEKYLSIRTDISALKKAADELELTQALKAANHGLRLGKFYLHAVLDSLPYQFWLKDVDGRYLVASQVLADACGRASPVELVGRTDFDLWPQEVAQNFRRIDDDVVRSQQAQNREVLQQAGGNCRWSEVFIKPLFAENAQVCGTVGLSHDISARKLAQIELEQRTALLDTILELSPDGLVSFDACRRVKYANPSFTRMTHIGLNQIIDRDEQVLADLLACRCSPSGRFPGFEAMRQSCGDGNRHLLELSSDVKRDLEMVLRQSDGGWVSQILYLRDITHETAVDRMKSEFLTTAAHELRTPMASIYGFAEILATQELDAASRAEFTEVLFRHSRGMVAVLNDLLDLARIEARRGLDFVLETTSVHDLIKAAVREFELPSGRLAPALRHALAPVLVLADASKMLKAIRNVLSNAYKYSPQGSDVAIDILPPKSLADTVTHVGIRITDHGIGMTPEQQSHVFERFYRADTSGKTLGTGLGMSIVHEVVSLHGGTVDLSSHLGLGTSVTLWLPEKLCHTDRPCGP